MERRIAAILAADMVGYSRLIELDEAETLARQKRHRTELIDPLIAKNNGRIVKLTGDGMIAEFGSVVEAVQCAVIIQKEIEAREAAMPEDRRIRYRVAVNLGDVVFDEGDIYGDGVNIAARLETLAEPGGIVVSGTAHDMLKTHVDVEYRFLGEKKLKNIAEPVRVFQVDDSGAARRYRKKRKLPVRVVAVAAVIAVAGSWLLSAILLNDTRSFTPKEAASIVVLPFEYLSGSDEQAHFAQGITEDLTTALSRFRELFVISSSTASNMRASDKTATEIGYELGVRYILEGSVRRSGPEIRLSAQLVDAVLDRQVWAQSIDRKWSDIFDLQDELTTKIVVSILPEIEADAIKRALRSDGMGLAAWETVAKAKWHANKFSVEDSKLAEALYFAAISEEPNNAAAYAYLSNLYTLDAIFGWHRPQPDSLKLAAENATKAVQLDDRNALAHTALAFVLHNLRRHREAVASAEKAILTNPNLAIAHGALGIISTYTHDFDKARGALERALSLSPRDPFRAIYVAHFGMIEFNAGRYADATQWFVQAIDENPRWPSPRRGLAANYGMLGDIEQARKPLEELRELLPDVTLAETRRAVGFAYADDADRFIEGLRRAGMPE